MAFIPCRVSLLSVLRACDRGERHHAGVPVRVRRGNRAKNQRPPGRCQTVTSNRQQLTHFAPSSSCGAELQRRVRCGVADSDA